MNAVNNFILSQIGWFACVLGGAYLLPWVGTLTGLTIVALHLWLSAEPREELKLIAVAALIGLCADSLLVTLGLTRYPSGMLVDGVAPHWIVVMWMLFATTVNVSLRWLKGNVWLAALFGAVGGPLAFYAGHRLGGVEFATPLWHSLAALAAIWAAAMPTLFALAGRWDGARVDTAAATS